ncbi:hypothetical protein [Pseudonocardia sp. NPDC046786]|uniref:hypothetical protein n=1 Tax=Pseudonocardia sp. NPDC046786 TaxID=3155471 RepID=UPI0033F28FA0
MADAERTGQESVQCLRSPHQNPAIVADTSERGQLSVPGGCAPTEIYSAWTAGADLAKVFLVQPAERAPLATIGGPLSDIPLLVCGRLTAELAAQCPGLGCDGVAAGLGLIDRDAAAAGDWPSPTDSCAADLAALS